MLRLGVIGGSLGNGHPYSWSAIFNGYDPIHMQQCEYPVIPEYLSKQNFPADALSGASVDFVWTQDAALSNRIAKASKIDTVLDDYLDMLGRVDAVLLARDDSENHEKFAVPFLNAGIPVYIDKPLAQSVRQAEKLLSHAKAEYQLFSTSALRYAEELLKLRSLPDIEFVDAFVMKDWDKYAIHLIEPLVAVYGVRTIKKVNKFRMANGLHQAVFEFDIGPSISIKTMASLVAPINLVGYGNNQMEKLVFKDTYSAFKQSLAAFIRQIETCELQIPRPETRHVIELLEQGNL